MRRQLFLASAGAIALAGTAFAADLPIAPPAASACLYLDRHLYRRLWRRGDHAYLVGNTLLGFRRRPCPI